MEAEAEFMKVQFVLRFLSIILRVFRLEVSVDNVYSTLQTSFKPLLLWGGGGVVKSLEEVTE
jgi:hypothetical protein